MLGSRFLAFAATLLPAVVQAAIVEYTWDVTYVNASPDGHPRKVIGINGQWPCPTIKAAVGDTIRVHMTNRLDDQTTGIHFHGINQIGTPWQDGPSGVTQCPLVPGSTITYEFLADEAGTYWYHSHDMGQYPDGLRGPMIIHDTFDPYGGMYDGEFVISVSDWYHNNSLDLVRSMLIPSNTLHQPPGLLEGPDSMLVNDGGAIDVSVQPGKTYRFRFINMAAISAFFLNFGPQFEMRVIMQDASYVKEVAVEQIRIATAQRYDVLVTIPEDLGEFNWPFLIAMDFHKNYRIDQDPPGIWPDMFNKFNVSGYMVLDEDYPRKEQEPLMALKPMNELLYEPLDKQEVWGPVDKEVTLTFTPGFDKTHGNPIMPFNGNAYVPQIVPTLYTAKSMVDYNRNESIYGQVNGHVLEIGDIVQIVINNNDTGIHPFHLHGHQFQLLDLPKPKSGIYHPDNGTGTGVAPGRKDTINIEPLSYAILRIRVTEPGVFLLHCHIEWHVEMGLTATFIQGPDLLAEIEIPEDHLQVCRDAGIPTEGNAAGNGDPFDITGFKTEHDVPYAGSQWPRPGFGPNKKLARTVERVRRF